MTLWTVNSAFFVSIISGTSFFPSFVRFPLGLISLKHVQPRTLARKFYRRLICLFNAWTSLSSYLSAACFGD